MKGRSRELVEQNVRELHFILDKLHSVRLGDLQANAKAPASVLAPKLPSATAKTDTIELL